MKRSAHKYICSYWIFCVLIIILLRLIRVISKSFNISNWGFFEMTLQKKLGGKKKNLLFLYKHQKIKHRESLISFRRHTIISMAYRHIKGCNF